MASTGTWMDFEQIRHNIKNNTVDRLKQIIVGLNEECGTHFSKTGKKQDIIDRIVHTLDSWQSINAEELFMKAKAIIYQVRNTGSYSSSRTPNFAPAPPATSSHATYEPAKPTQFLPTASSSTSHVYDPYAPPRRPPPVSAPASIPKPSIRFKDSPYFTLDQPVTPVIECPESTGAQDRRQQNVNFTLNNEIVVKLRKPGSQFQLRLFCTSSIFYAGLTAFRTTTLPCPIEFPPTCEVRVNNTQITANLKGLKKKPGTAPPPDITKYVRLSTGNKVDIVYVNSQVPVQSKKYYMIVMLVEAIPIDTIIANLKSQKTWNADNVKQQMIQAMTEDDDIVAGPQRMSLKCPLTFVRISTPCRSSKCVHPQCFDATSWFTMMEQTTTYLCPVCERTLDPKDLIIDGYFNEILQQTPESVEDVMVEANAQWHTSDDKYGSADWKAAHPPAPKSLTPSNKPPTPASSCPPTDGTRNSDGKQKSDVEILVLDSDDESDEEGRVKRELSPSYSSTNQSFDGTLPLLRHPPQRTESSSNVIDLTLSDSEDEAPPPPPRRMEYTTLQGKRKATEAEVDLDYPSGDQSWKRGRTEETTHHPLPRLGLNSALANNSSPLLSSSSTSSHIGTPNGHSNGHFGSAFASNTLPPPVPTFPAYNSSSRSNGINGNPIELPPLPSSYVPRPPSQNTRWQS